ncbi:MAG: hypothetical protein RIQ89_1283 [Bacteroidota bacterium]|jgi:signal peptidase I
MKKIRINWELVKDIIFGIFTLGVWFLLKTRPGQRKSNLREWVDAAIFAVIAATIIRTFIFEAYTIPTSSMEKSLLVGDFLFVSKMSYGARIPNTPLSFPFVHNTLPFGNAKSYLEWIKIGYHRLPGFGKIKKGDCVVFNYPAETEGRPVDKKENYIKRCVGTPGDTLKIINQQVFINGTAQKNPEQMQHAYAVFTDGSAFNFDALKRIGWHDWQSMQEQLAMGAHENYQFNITETTAGELKNFGIVKAIEKYDFNKLSFNRTSIFPNSEKFSWTPDGFGPLYIPKKGDVVKIDSSNIALYRRAIQEYEKNNVEEKNGQVWINGTPANSYTFKMDYYFMMGDNRHNSQDSRFWGFVPEDHIVGKAVFVWMSWETNESNIFKKIRWERLFHSVSSLAGTL